MWIGQNSFHGKYKVLRKLWHLRRAQERGYQRMSFFYFWHHLPCCSCVTYLGLPHLCASTEWWSKIGFFRQYPVVHQTTIECQYNREAFTMFSIYWRPIIFKSQSNLSCCCGEKLLALCLVLFWPSGIPELIGIKKIFQKGFVVPKTRSCLP